LMLDGAGRPSGGRQITPKCSLRQINPQYL
jgi:hypothetical protein